MKTRLLFITITLALAGCATTGPTLPAPIPVELEQARGTTSVPPAK